MTRSEIKDDAEGGGTSLGTIGPSYRYYDSIKDNDEKKDTGAAPRSSSTTTSTTTRIPGENSATILNEIFNLIKNIVGSGGFSLPAAIATFGNAPSALMPTYILILIMGIINAYTFSLLGRICYYTQTRSYKDAWDITVGTLVRKRRKQSKHNQSRQHTTTKEEDNSSAVVEDGNKVSNSTVAHQEQESNRERQHLLPYHDNKNMSENEKHHNNNNNHISWSTHIVAMVVVTKTFFGCWGFSIMLSSSFQPILINIGFSNITKIQSLILLTVVVILPLCMSQTFRSLAIFSAFGQLGTLFAIGVMWIRYVDGTYKEPNGYYYQMIENTKYIPLFGTKGWLSIIQSYQSLILISILSTGYMAHYNAPKFFYELKDTTPKRFNIVVIISFICSGIIFCFVSTLGFMTFGQNCSGYILDNYSTYDPLAFVARLGIVISLIFSYPLLFIGGREGLLDLIQIPIHKRTPMTTKIWTIILLSIITFLAFVIPDLTFLLSFTGATLSTCLIYIFPSLMLRAMSLINNNEVTSTTANEQDEGTAKDVTQEEPTTSNSSSSTTITLPTVSSTELRMTTIIMFGGIIAGVCGATISVLDAIQKL